MYVSELSLEPAWQGRNIEVALVHRICDTLGGGCELAVIDYASEAKSQRWQRMGFTITTPGQETGYLHLPLAVRLARVVLDQNSASYRIVTNPPPGRAQH